ncbi:MULTISPECIES: cytochrome c-550 PedF [Hyphomicrobium]|jgi:cytochrome c-550 PedF|uniref:cytochrome c-550 PedF n=1 Tax=Hyphomicrobium TaxID=81 RepID=UPI00036E3E3D|nr:MULTISPECIES: cytochrome c-550 PedF [Hyphomicrobium]WBT36286.1 cytochrome c-550 PedF [Hyphomicrobium sp. DMF-1]
MFVRPFVAALAAAILLIATDNTRVLAHGDVTPQPIDTAGLEPLGEEWRKENPYRDNAKAIEIGESGYTQNCARCHGLEVISGGLAPDLRHLDKGPVGDEWFMERIRHGAKKTDGTTIMPAFEGTFSQEAMWAIRAYVESKFSEQ